MKPSAPGSRTGLKAGFNEAWAKLRPPPASSQLTLPIWTGQETVVAAGAVIASLFLVLALDEAAHLLVAFTPSWLLAVFGFLTHA
ncbi:MAG: hypothetical protein AAGH82_02925, partial [Pseudomonadota bacterium]